MAFLDGSTGGVLIEDVEYGFGKWRYNLKHTTVPNNHFMCRGQKDFMNGFAGGTLKLSAPNYDAGNMPFQLGMSATFDCYWDDDFFISVPGTIVEIDMGSEADKDTGLEITVESASSVGELAIGIS